MSYQIQYNTCTFHRIWYLEIHFLSQWLIAFKVEDTSNFTISNIRAFWREMEYFMWILSVQWRPEAKKKRLAEEAIWKFRHGASHHCLRSNLSEIFPELVNDIIWRDHPNRSYHSGLSDEITSIFHIYETFSLKNCKFHLLCIRAEKSIMTKCGISCTFSEEILNPLIVLPVKLTF